MKLLKANNWKHLLIHLGLAIGGLVLIVIIFFFLYLPSTTNHGETLTVPSLKGMPFAEIDRYLTQRNLRYEVTADSSYDASAPPLTILQQDPGAGAKVKENRKIYITLNARTVPFTKMPNLQNGSQEYALEILQNVGLKKGKIQYVNDISTTVLEQRYKGKIIRPGEKVPQGAKIDLKIGDGRGRSITFKTPALTGMAIEDAKFVIIGSGLRLGRITYTDAPTNEAEPGTVIAQSPVESTNIRAGNYVDLVVVRPTVPQPAEETLLNGPGSETPAQQDTIPQLD